MGAVASNSYECLLSYCCQETGDIELTVAVRSCLMNTVHNYGNRKHVFRLETVHGSAYLFETESEDVMLDWIRAIKRCIVVDNEEVK